MSSQNYRRGASPLASSLLLLAIPAFLHADVTGVTGSISSNESISRYGFSQSITIALQAGTGFSLNAFISSDNLVKTSANSQTVTFYPAGSTSDVVPLVIAASPGYNNGTLVYNGVTYNNLQINLSPVGAPATVANSGSPSNYYFYNGSVSSVPFLLKGTVTAYAAPPNQGVGSSAPLLTVNFSGGGVFGGGISGSFPSSGSPGSNGSVTYTFLANPLGFSTDATTQGSWTGNYGGEGYLVPNGPVYAPSYAAVSTLYASPYTWAPQTTDVRALQNGPGYPYRIASAYTGNSFNINLNFTDQNPHRVALYLLDFDTSGRSETLTVTNADTGAILDTETITNFQNGIYAIWNLQGNVTINAKRASGGSAVVSGIFFGPPATVLSGASSTIPPSRVSFFGTESATKSAWKNLYGAGGYMIANGPSGTPTQATMSVTGATTFTWAGLTTDSRALAINSQGGIASAYTQYPSTSFLINLNTNSGATMKLSLYLLDWDNEGRAETITISDLSTGVVLDTETLSQFQGGIYVSWLVSGNVVVKITPSVNTSPAVSGIFLN